MNNTEQNTTAINTENVNKSVVAGKGIKNKNDINEKLKRARTQREKIAIEVKKFELAQKKAEDTEKQWNEAKNAREEAEKKIRKLRTQSEVILRIAGREQERREHRRRWAVTGFFELITFFNSDGKKDFSRLCYSLNDTEIVYRALMASVVYNRENDCLCINGTEFRRIIDEEKKNFDSDLAEARKILAMDDMTNQKNTETV